jgi:hypothetical protein
VRFGWDDTPRTPSPASALVAMVVLILTVYLSGCAIGRIETPEGIVIEGAALGKAGLSCCDHEYLPPGVEGPVQERCVKIEGGVLSTTFAEALATVGTVLAAVFTGGAAGIW